MFLELDLGGHGWGPEEMPLKRPCGSFRVGVALLDPDLEGSGILPESF